MSRASYLFTSESVSEGHPDKVCDRISDEVVDAFFDHAPRLGWDVRNVRVACETLCTTNRVVIAGETRGPHSITRAGLALTGTEVKSAREGQIQLKDSYAEVVGDEAWLVNAHISPYSHGNRQNHDPVRRRKLLLHRHEIDKLLGKTREKGLTLVCTKVYLKNGRIKCELALGRGKKLHDKREAERTRTQQAEARAAMRRHNA